MFLALQVHHLSACPCKGHPLHLWIALFWVLKEHRAACPCLSARVPVTLSGLARYGTWTRKELALPRGSTRAGVLLLWSRSVREKPSRGPRKTVAPGRENRFPRATTHGHTSRTGGQCAINGIS